MVGDLVVDVPPESQLHRQVVRKEAEVRSIEVDPVVRLYYVEVDEPDLASPSGRPATAARRAGARLVAHRPRLPTCTWCASSSGAPGGGVDGHRRRARRPTITPIWPGFRDVALGVAFDVGSTTVAGHLCDLASGDVLASAGAMNPQIRFGEDLMSRVSYVMLNPGSQAELTDGVRDRA